MSALRLARTMRFAPRGDVVILTSLAAVAFLESMGLPKPLLHATRKQVEQGKLDFSTTEEYKLYARHNKPVDSE